jgi:hypothetical protein
MQAVIHISNLNVFEREQERVPDSTETNYDVTMGETSDFCVGKPLTCCHSGCKVSNNRDLIALEFTYFTILTA